MSDGGAGQGPAGVLRDVLVSDLPVFFEHQRDPEASRMAAVPTRDWNAFIAHWQRILADEHSTKKTISDGERVAGYVVAFDHEGERLVGYWVGRDHWGKGLATRALAELVELETARPLRARVVTANRGSIRVLEKCGFVFRGLCSEEDWGLDGGVEEALFELR